MKRTHRSDCNADEGDNGGLPLRSGRRFEAEDDAGSGRGGEMGEGAAGGSGGALPPAGSGGALPPAGDAQPSVSRPVVADGEEEGGSRGGGGIGGGGGKLSKLFFNGHGRALPARSPESLALAGRLLCPTGTGLMGGSPDGAVSVFEGCEFVVEDEHKEGGDGGAVRSRMVLKRVPEAPVVRERVARRRTEG